MAIEILTGQQNTAAPVMWRSVTAELIDTSDEAKIAAASRLDQARRDGFANGLAAARQEAEQAITPAMQKLADSLAQVARVRDSIREQGTDDLVRLALAVASRVLHHDVVLDSAVLAGLLRAGFAKLRAQEISVARIQPAMEPILRGCLDRNGTLTNLYVLTDPKLKPGELVFDTDAAADSPASDTSVNIDLSEIERGLIDNLPK